MDAKKVRETLDELASEAALCERKGEIDRALLLWQAHERVEAEYLREAMRTTGTYAAPLKVA